MPESFKHATAVFRKAGGILRMSEAIRSGVSRRTLYTMTDNGMLERLSRGVYRLATLPTLGDPDLVTVATRVPNGVVCLISALAFSELTTQIPRAIDIAIPRGTGKPRIEYPPTNIYWFSGEAFTEGVDTPTLDGTRVQIYTAEKSIADAFKYRNKIGLDVALESLRTWRTKRTSNIGLLLKYARVCRVERIMLPYLEAMT